MSAIGIAAAKQLADSSTVGLADKIVTAVFAGGFYIEESDRNTGIRVVPVETLGVLAVGSLVDIGGTMQTANGERYVEDATVVVK